MVFDALQRCLSSKVAAFALVVNAIDEKAAGFYGHLGFMPFPSQPLRLFLPLATARKLLSSSI